MAVSNERDPADKSGTVATVVIGTGLLAVIYGLAPGARHWYKHGRLPPASAAMRWRAK